MTQNLYIYYPKIGLSALLKGRVQHICRDEDPDPLIFCLSDPDPDHTCTEGFIKLCSSWNNIYPRIKKFKRKMMVYNVEFYEYVFFFISI